MAGQLGGHADGQSVPSVALVSMPWMGTGMPSIQLATLGNALLAHGFQSTSYEFFLDYAARIGLKLYDLLSNAGGFIEEWIFARHYFEWEAGNDLAAFRQHRPRFGLESVELEDQVLDALAPVTASFLEELAQSPLWSYHDVVGVSLTISQTAASMALARLLKEYQPHLFVVFGGSSCAGPMGPALMRVCPYVDAIVCVEGEVAFPEVVRRVRQGEGLRKVPGVISRTAADELVGTPKASLYHTVEAPRELNFDGYFARLERLGLADRIPVWLPFESSRGCWWGEKNQCTFCGLHEVMLYRGRDPDSVMALLESLSERYGVSRFFAVDLIMPKEYLKSLLPGIVQRGHDWSLFYEVKANLKREEVEQLAAAGVRWIQPGIESLDDGVLRAMKKGVSALQNVQLLKWCEESGIRVTWNLLMGIPGEDAEAYKAMARLMPALFHLPPPSGASAFQLHRFSPYFEHPGDYGIQRRGAHPLYRYIFPVNEDVLDDLVYIHDFSLDQAPFSGDYTASARDAVREWRLARARGAELGLSVDVDGRAEIRDTRTLPGTVETLTPAETRLYAFLDRGQPIEGLGAAFVGHDPEAAAALAGSGGVDAVIAGWERKRFVVRLRGRVVAVAVRQPKNPQTQNDGDRSPVAYLGEPVRVGLSKECAGQ